MNKWKKITGITVGIILIFFLVLFVIFELFPQLFGNYKPDYEFDKRIRSEIVQRIDNYIEQNNRLPESLSEIDFEQLPGLYKYRGHSVCLIKCADLDYVLEYWHIDVNNITPSNIGEKSYFKYSGK